MQETWAGSLGQENPRSRSWHPIPVFWPGKFRGQRSLADCSPRGLKETRLSAGHGEEFAFFFGLKWEPPESLEQEERVM